MTSESLMELLNRLAKSSAESKWLEFKHNFHSAEKRTPTTNPENMPATSLPERNFYVTAK